MSEKSCGSKLYGCCLELIEKDISLNGWKEFFWKHRIRGPAAGLQSGRACETDSSILSLKLGATEMELHSNPIESLEGL
jgi:hypothetical protein